MQTCALQVLDWAVQHLAAGPPPGRFASDAEWRTVINKRRDAAAPAPTFLQDLLQALAQQHVGPGCVLYIHPCSLHS
jgi:hypothetical protein